MLDKQHRPQNVREMGIRDDTGLIFFFNACGYFHPVVDIVFRNNPYLKTGSFFSERSEAGFAKIRGGILSLQPAPPDDFGRLNTGTQRVFRQRLQELTILMLEPDKTPPHPSLNIDRIAFPLPMEQIEPIDFIGEEIE